MPISRKRPAAFGERGWRMYRLEDDDEDKNTGRALENGMNRYGTVKARIAAFAALLPALLLLTSCATMRPADRVMPPVEIPAQFTLIGADEPGPGPWWEGFGSAELNKLVGEALSDNFDIRTAQARLGQAMAQARLSGADLSPTLTARAEAAKRRASIKIDEGSRAEITEIDQYTLGLAAAYEVDLWGRLRSTRTADMLFTDAAREDVDAAAVTVAAEVVNAWLDVVSFRRQQFILSEQIDLNERLLQLQRLRFENGLATALDVSQQMENLASVRADMPLLQAREIVAAGRLSLLLGRAGTIEIGQQDLPEPIALPETGIPADLLASRPDVRAAGLRLTAADWRIAAARANRLPSLNLSAGASFSSTALDVLFSNWLTTLAANLAAPLLDGGRRAAEVERSRAVAEERLSTYGNTVARAVREVEDGLHSEDRQREFIDRLGEQLDAARLAMREARLRYLNGTSDYLNYLVGIQNVQRLERRIVVERAELLKLRVGLHRAVGGDWTRQLADAGERHASADSASPTTEQND
jgi:outer membrane protein, multidrug efflux system